MLAEVRRNAAGLYAELDYSAGTLVQLLANATFTSAVEALAGHAAETPFLLRLARDRDPWVSRIALAVLVDRRDLPADWTSYVVRRLEAAAYDHGGLFLRTLWHAPGEVIGPVLAHIGDVDTIDAAELVTFRVSQGLETVDAELFRRHVAIAIADDVGVMLGRLRVPALRARGVRGMATDDDCSARVQRPSSPRRGLDHTTSRRR